MRRLAGSNSGSAGSRRTSASLLLDSMVLGLEQIEDSSEYEPYIDMIFKEV